MSIKHIAFTSLLTTILLTCCDKRAENYFSLQSINIYNFQDQRLADSLVTLLSGNNHDIIMLASLAMASVQDTTANKTLFSLLKNNNADIRRNAAFALGQTGGIGVADKLQEAISAENVVEVNISMLEALGKVIQKENTDWIIEYTTTNNFAAEGVAWCLYQIGLRGVATSSLLDLGFNLFKEEINTNARLGLAHFFARTNSLDFDKHSEELLRLISEESNTDVQMALILATRKINHDKTLRVLNHLFNTSEDYRIKINICRALVNYDWKDVESLFLKALIDLHPQVNIAAAESFRLNEESEIENLIIQSREIDMPLAKSLVYKRILSSTKSTLLIEDILHDWQNAGDPYSKSFYTDLIPYVEGGIDTLRNIVLNNSPSVLQTAAIQSLTALDTRDKLKEGRSVQLDFYKKALTKGDLAVIGIISAVLTNGNLNYKEIVGDISFLYAAKSNLVLPRDNEALQQLEKCIAYFEGKETQEIVNDYNNPIDWEVLQKLNNSSKAKVKTEKGNIILQLLAKEAPGSVANFVKLSQSGYYKDKNFHRVVPNFVIQGGCYRGDGWGSEDYSIRSEFGLRKYTTGSVGMASAGKDTEGTQWFITHSPTPHLDGKYTIFAVVIEGMEIVHQIQIGDKIIDIEIY
jgi:cyclophilin family peptidyl-prolyl cis-trans isomerase